jgi:hypothetical protein
VTSSRVRVAIVFVIVAAVLAAACGGDSDKKSKSKPPPTTTTTIAIPIAPLTGLEDPGGASLTRAAITVKIENTPEARPQSGLDVADVVYEEVVDGGITRFWAVFNSAAPENVGPVRSVRAMDPQIVTPFHGVLAYSGGTNPNVALIRSTGLAWVDENNAGDAFFREPARSAPHNLYARSAQLFQRAVTGQTAVPPTAVFTYVDTKSGQTFGVGEPVASLHVNYQQGYDCTYVWDAPTGTWLRLQRTNEPFMATGSTPAPVQVAPVNVIVQFIPYAGAGEGNLIGTGDAWVFSNGQLVRGRWTKPDIATPITYTDAAGLPINLTPGRTWVELLPIGRTVDVVPGAPLPTTTTSTTKPAKKKQ